MKETGEPRTWHLSVVLTSTKEGTEVFDTLDDMPAVLRARCVQALDSKECQTVVIADEAGPTAGFSAEIAAVVTEDAATFARLKAPVKRVCALQVPIPYSPVLENHVFPDRNRIAAGIREVLRARGPAAAA